MKKLLSIMLAASLVVSLAACSQPEEPVETTSDTAASAEEDSTETASDTESEESETADSSDETDENAETESSSDEETSQETMTDAASENGNVLIAYFSWSGNTAEMASYIQEQTGGDLFEIQPVTPYPEDYGECGDVALEERDNNARPEIQNLPESLDGYDTIFIGYPIWWHTAPMIIGTFLENYDLTGIEVYPFTQSASMDTEQFNNSMDFVREMQRFMTGCLWMRLIQRPSVTI